MSRQPRDLPLYQYDLGTWFSKFASCLRNAPLGNPFARLLDEDPECSPYFITFALYWYRVPGRTLAEKGRRDTLRALNLTRTMARRLRRDALELREIAGFKFPPPWGRQLSELRVKSAPKSSAAALKQIAAACKRGASFLSARVSILKELASAKRRPRNAAAMVLWLHMGEKMGKGMAGSLLSALIDCADVAFQNESKLQQWAALDLACKRYQERFPSDYKRRKREARRNRKELPPWVEAQWRRLNSEDCESIVEGLRPRFEREVGRIRGTTQSY